VWPPMQSHLFFASSSLPLGFFLLSVISCSASLLLWSSSSSSSSSWNLDTFAFFLTYD
jgi:hypothetical protein